MSKRILGLAFSWFSLIFFSGSLAVAQNPRPTPSPSPSPVAVQKETSPEAQFFKNILRDQKAIWTAPFKLHGDDARSALLLGAGTAGLIATDRHTSSGVDRNGNLLDVSRGVSQGGTVYATAGIAGAFYFFGRAAKDRRARETGVLSAEALIDTGIVTEVLKFATQRARPNADDGRGHFFTSGNSFPSGHSSSIWSVATVISYEYQDRPWIRYGAYAAAAAVSMSRFSGRNHFLSDVLVGSAIGFYTGRYVYRAHHIDESDPAPPKKITKLMPAIVPIYRGRTGTYGGLVAWRF